MSRKDEKSYKTGYLNYNYITWEEKNPKGIKKVAWIYAELTKLMKRKGT